VPVLAPARLLSGPELRRRSQESRGNRLAWEVTRLYGIEASVSLVTRFLDPEDAPVSELMCVRCQSTGLTGKC